MCSLQQGRAQDWARQTLTTIGAACRAVKAESLEWGIDWIVEELTVEYWSVSGIQATFALC